MVTGPVVPIDCLNVEGAGTVKFGRSSVYCWRGAPDLHHSSTD